MTPPGENYISSPGAQAKVRRALGRQDVYVFQEKRMKWFYVFWRGRMVGFGLSPSVRSTELRNLKKAMRIAIHGNDREAVQEAKLNSEKGEERLREKVKTYYDGEVHKRVEDVRRWSFSKSVVVK